MDTILFGISNCDTVKRARAWLKARSVEYQFHDYKKLGCSKDQASQFVSHLGVEAVINRRGTTWRSLSDDQKKEITEESAVLLMCEYPSLIKRPIFNQENIWLIGFDESAWHELLSHQTER